MTYQLFLRLDGHRSPVLMLSFDSTASRLVSAALDGFKIWDMTTGSEVPHHYHPQGSKITAALWLERTDQPDLLFTASEDGVILLWDLSHGVFAPITSSPATDHAAITSVDVKAMSEEHWLICACEANGALTMWDAYTTGRVIVRWRADHKRDFPDKVAFVGSDRVAVVRSTSRVIVEFEEGNYLDVFQKFSLRESLINMTLHGPTRRFVGDSPEAHGLHVGCFTVPERMRTLSSRHPRCLGPVGNLGFAENGNKVVIGTDNGLALIYDFPTAKLLEKIRIGGYDSFVHSTTSITCNGDAFLAVATADLGRQNTITIYKFREQTVPGSIPFYMMIIVFVVWPVAFVVFMECVSGRLHF